VADRHGADLHGLLLDLVRSVGLLHVVDPGTAGSGGSVSVSELFALHELDAGGGLSQQELAERLRLEKSTVSRLVAGLEVRGLLVRERDPANRRFVRLSLTAAGQRLHVDLARAMHERQGAVLAAMTPSERAALQTGLVGLLRALHHLLHDSLHDRPRAHVDR
jgi:DNA-binding MarR family transcriptional regulator